MAQVTVREVQPPDWPAIEALFGTSGGCSGCWCMWWRVASRKEFNAMQGAKARAALRRLITTGEIRALVAFSGPEAVGWCSYGPRSDFPLTETKRSYVVDDAVRVWSVNCFFVRRDHRRRGVARLLLHAAVEASRRAGAKVIEGYPKLPKRRQRIPDSSIYTGTLSMFREAGFDVAQRLYPGSPLLRRSLTERR